MYDNNIENLMAVILTNQNLVVSPLRKITDFSIWSACSMSSFSSRIDNELLRLLLQLVFYNFFVNYYYFRSSINKNINFIIF
ncbi:hypothetical protein PGB90_002355 [Kerria lacca]